MRRPLWTDDLRDPIRLWLQLLRVLHRRRRRPAACADVAAAPAAAITSGTPLASGATPVASGSALASGVELHRLQQHLLRPDMRRALWTANLRNPNRL